MVLQCAMAEQGEAAGSTAHEPMNYSFPSRTFGRKGEKRCFKTTWFKEWPWLDYTESSDSVTCFYCSKAILPKIQLLLQKATLTGRMLVLLSSELKLDSSLIYNKYTYIRRHQSSKMQL